MSASDAPKPEALEAHERLDALVRQLVSAHQRADELWVTQALDALALEEQAPAGVSSARVSSEPDDALRALIPSEARALTALWGRAAPMTVQALAQQLGLERTSVTRLAQRLESAGLLVRARAERDARARALGLSPRGQRLAQALVRAQQAHQRALWAKLDPLSQHTLALALPQLIAALEGLSHEGLGPKAQG